MACIYRRGQVWWTKFKHRGALYRKSLRTSNRHLARDRARQLESSIKDGCFTLATSCTPTPLIQVLEAFCEFLRTTKTAKSAQTDIYYLRQLFGPVCPALQINARKPISAKELLRRIAAAKPSELRPGPTHLRPVFIEDLTTAAVSSFLTDRMRQRQLAPKTVNRLREVAHRICQWCATQRNVRFPGNVNPVSAVERVRESAPEVRFLGLEQIAKQLDVLDPYPQLRVMVAALIYAGLRREEMVWLTPGDFDVRAGMIRVRAKTIESDFWEPKTKRNRAIPISQTLADILQEYKPSQAAQWYFPSPRGFRWDPDNFSRRLRAINRKHGLPWSCLDYRHTFGSQLAQKGVSLTKIAELMGNSPEICRRHYVALLPEQMTDVVEFDRWVSTAALKMYPACDGDVS